VPGTGRQRAQATSAVTLGWPLQPNRTQGCAS
jgi:hypothetical protein